MKLKKLKVNKNVKWGIMTVLIAVVGVLSFFYIKASQKVVTKEEEKILYEYTYNTDIKYAVNLLPNNLYEEEKLGEGQIYLAELIKSINNHFTASFTGSESAKISGNYKIDAQVAGYTVEKTVNQEVKKDIWSKNFELVPEQIFQGEGESFEVQKTAQVDYKNYSNFAKAIQESTKANVPIELRVLVTGKIVVETPYETIEKPIQLITRMPLGTNYFTIVTEGEGEMKDSIKETQVITLLPDQKVRAPYLIGIGISVVVFLLIGVLTTPLTVEDMRLKEIRYLLAVCSRRMVGVKVIDDAGYDVTYEVKSLEDLVKLADELEQPLIYEANGDMLAIRKFYVMDKQKVYTYALEEQEVKQIMIKKDKKESLIGQIADKSMEM